MFLIKINHEFRKHIGGDGYVNPVNFQIVNPMYQSIIS